MVSERRRRSDARRRDRTRRAILDAAARLLPERGYHGTSVGEVVRAAGLSQGSFYNHFANRRDVAEALLEELGGRLFASLSALADAPPPQAAEGLAARRERVTEAAVHLCEALEREWPLVAFFLREGPTIDRTFAAGIDAIFTDFVRLVAAHVEDGVDRGLLRPCDPEIVGQCVVGVVHRMATSWWPAGIADRLGIRDAVTEVADLLYQGLAPRG